MGCCRSAVDAKKKENSRDTNQFGFSFRISVLSVEVSALTSQYRVTAFQEHQADYSIPV